MQDRPKYTQLNQLWRPRAETIQEHCIYTLQYTHGCLVGPALTAPRQHIKNNTRTLHTYTKITAAARIYLLVVLAWPPTNAPARSMYPCLAPVSSWEVQRIVSGSKVQNIGKYTKLGTEPAKIHTTQPALTPPRWDFTRTLHLYTTIHTWTLGGTGTHSAATTY